MHKKPFYKREMYIVSAALMSIVAAVASGAYFGQVNVSLALEDSLSKAKITTGLSVKGGLTVVDTGLTVSAGGGIVYGGLTVADTGIGVTSGGITVASGGIYASNGSAVSPSITFRNSPSTGLYRATANTIGIAANGLEVMRINSKGLVVGTSENPSGITLYDDITGRPSCVSLHGGDLIAKAGACQ